MAKELPYFKFYTSDWSNGDITLETYELQGLFINICAYYWSKDCQLSLVNLIKKFRFSEDKINELVNSKILKVDRGNIKINFLIEQMGSKEIQKITNQINGKKGGRPRKLETEKKPNGLFIENRNETETKPNQNREHNPNETNIKERKGKKNNTNSIELRKKEFSASLKPFLETYGKDTLNDFYSYWTEPNKSGTLFKQEMERTWNTAGRLRTWAKREKTFVKAKTKSPAAVDQSNNQNLFQ